MQFWKIPTTLALLLIILSLGTTVLAEESPADDSDSTLAASELILMERSPRVEVGANLRSDFGVHALRFDAAYSAEHFRVLLTLDPWFWTDGQSSTDLLGFYRTSGLEPFLGWRLNAIPAVDGAQLQHNLLLGTALRFPDFWGGRISGQWGFETALMLYKHGGGVPSNSISFASGRHYLDFINFGMFARFHYNISLGGR